MSQKIQFRRGTAYNSVKGASASNGEPLVNMTQNRSYLYIGKTGGNLPALMDIGMLPVAQNAATGANNKYLYLFDNADSNDPVPARVSLQTIIDMIEAAASGADDKMVATDASSSPNYLGTVLLAGNSVVDGADTYHAAKANPVKRVISNGVMKHYFTPAAGTTLDFDPTNTSLGTTIVMTNMNRRETFSVQVSALADYIGNKADIGHILTDFVRLGGAKPLNDGPEQWKALRQTMAANAILAYPVATSNALGTMDGNTLVTKSYVDGKVEGLSAKYPVDLVLTSGWPSDIDTAPITIDGYTIVAGTRVIRAEGGITGNTNNGIWEAWDNAGTLEWRRPVDADTGTEVHDMFVYCNTPGNAPGPMTHANDNKVFVCTNTSAPTLGSDNVIIAEWKSNTELFADEEFIDIDAGVITFKPVKTALANVAALPGTKQNNTFVLGRADGSAGERLSLAKFMEGVYAASDGYLIGQDTYTNGIEDFKVRTGVSATKTGGTIVGDRTVPTNSVSSHKGVASFCDETFDAIEGYVSIHTIDGGVI